MHRNLSVKYFITVFQYNHFEGLWDFFFFAVVLTNNNSLLSQKKNHSEELSHRGVASYHLPFGLPANRKCQFLTSMRC